MHKKSSFFRLNQKNVQDRAHQSGFKLFRIYKWKKS